MLKPIFTLDYEIHGNGDGCPLKLMVRPTDRMLDLFDAFGAKLTIMADAAEILAFRRHAKQAGRDDFHAGAIQRQLRDAIRRGHDVQLHIHSSYFGARHEAGRWVQDWSEYDFASLPLDRMTWMVGEGKSLLESLLCPVDPAYRCQVFRAANWSVSPSKNVVQALLDNDICIDTSVFKFGRRSGRVQFDYSAAPSALLPWRVDSTDVCRHDEKGRLWEFPIYSEARRIPAFGTPQRIWRALVGGAHRLSDKALPVPPPAARQRRTWGTRLFGRHAWKADFNQCSGPQLIAALERASSLDPRHDTTSPFVLIGHSKLYSRLNEWSLRPFLAYVRNNPERYEFGKFSDFTLPT